MNRQAQPRVLGRYLFYAPIAAGGMATVYLGRMAGPKGFSRIVAIKQLHAQLIHDTDFVTMFLDEAHIIGRIHHSNVVAPIDVVEADGDLCIVMEYVHGEALGRLMRLSRQDRMPLRVVSAIMTQTLLGLHAAHEVTDVNGKPLCIVHRDVSPQNVLVGEDGIARVVDFGIAQAAHRSNAADIGKLKGKLGYMAPEQLFLKPIDRRCDLFAAGIILWEMLTGKKLFSPDGPSDAAERMTTFEARPPSSIVSTLPAELDAITTRALCVDPDQRFSNALEMARALEEACPPASAIEVAEWMTALVGDTLRTRAEWIAELSSMDLGEWTQTFVMSSSLPLVVSSAPPPLDPSSVEHARPAEAPGVGQSQALPASAPCPSAPRLEPPARTPTRLERLRVRTLWLLPVGLVGLLLASFGLWRRVNAASAPRQAAAYAAKAVESSDVAAASTTFEATPATPWAATPEASPATALESAGAASSLQAQANAASKHANVSSSCRVPYYYDRLHIKRFKTECFKRH